MHDLADLPFPIVFEFSPDGRLHVHGLMVPMGKPHFAISKALCEAGCKVFGKAAARQLTVKPLFGGQGCKSYCLKVRKATNVLLADRRYVIMNRPLNAAVQDFHENNRPRKLRTAKLDWREINHFVGAG